ncbi:MAG TPA: DMT family transporter [Steroidobacteraceae bacterium]
MNFLSALHRPGVLAALTAALLFGCSTPLAKWLLATLDPWLLAGLLYLGSGLGLTLYRSIIGAPAVRLPRNEWGWLIGAILVGGIAGPVLLMMGLREIPASQASLLLNAEGVFTVLLAWLVFGEHFDRRIALGVAAIVAGALVLSWPTDLHLGALWATAAVLGACLCWAIDNNLTRKVSLTDATWIAATKGLVAGTVNLALAISHAAHWPNPLSIAAALGIGWAAYGVSLSLFVVGLRHLGSARTGAYFSIAPFFGAALAVLAFNEALTANLAVAGALMGLGVWLHLTEKHSHPHTHSPLEHEHEHVHDEHHQHVHDEPVPPHARHSHRHWHEPLTHTHAHFPDSHHQHGHGG